MKYVAYRCIFWHSCQIYGNMQYILATCILTSCNHNLYTDQSKLRVLILHPGLVILYSLSHDWYLFSTFGQFLIIHIMHTHVKEVQLKSMKGIISENSVKIHLILVLTHVQVWLFNLSLIITVYGTWYNYIL